MEKRKRPVLLTEPAKIVRRRRTADEAGISLVNFETVDAYKPSPKILRRARDGTGERDKEKASKWRKPVSLHRPIQHQSSVAIGHATTSPAGSGDVSSASDWPMSGKEKAQPSRRMERVKGLNVSFPLVFDISQSISDSNDDQIMDCDEALVENAFDDIASLQVSVDGMNLDLNAVLSHFTNVQRATGGATTISQPVPDISGITTAAAAFSNLSVSEHSNLISRTKTKKRRVYLLIVFASYDATHGFKCDAYVTCVNRASGRFGRQRLGLNRVISKLIEMFIQQIAATRRFNSNQRWLIACCMVEALAYSPLILNMNAYWRHVTEGILVSPFDCFLRHIACQLEICDGVQLSSIEFARQFSAPAIQSAASHLSLHVLTVTENSEMEHENGYSSSAANGQLCENLVLASMVSQAACWMIEEYNRLQLTTPEMSSICSELPFNHLP